MKPVQVVLSTQQSRVSTVNVEENLREKIVLVFLSNLILNVGFGLHLVISGSYFK